MIEITGTPKKRIAKSFNCYLFILPFFILFTLFIILPVLSAVIFSFTNFNMLEIPEFVGISNYIRMFLDDDEFLISVKNTLIFAVITGPLSYVLSFILAWLICEFGRTVRTLLTIIFYMPSMSGSVYMIWSYIFSGDQYGLANSVLMQMGIVDKPVQWLTDSATIMPVIIIVQLWMSLGVSFLSFVAGLQSTDKQLYEAASVDGLKNRWQELFYITIPSMGSQLLFSAVMQITAAFSVSGICVTLAGFYSTDNAALTFVTHIEDMGSVRFEMGYACALSVVLFVVMYALNNIIQKFIRKHTAI